ncbi:C-type lectin fold [Trinorchestia longiramus]|nr:C-type lectin fold [Trinorchestia longiramus]
MCASECLANKSCGGFHFVQALGIPCYLLVDEFTPGSQLLTLGNGMCYKMLDYQRGHLRVFTVSETYVSFNSARQHCLDNGMELVPRPIYPRDYAILRINTRINYWLDLQRQEDGTYRDVNQQIQTTEGELNRWMSGEPSGGDEKCVVLVLANGLFSYGDRLCEGNVTMNGYCVLKV